MRARRALAACALLAAAAALALRASEPLVPSYAVVRALHAPSEARLLDRRGRELQ